MIILGLDIAPGATGAAVGDGSSPPRSFVAQFAGKDRGAIGAKYMAWLRDLLVMERPDLVAFEAPLVKIDRQSSVETTRLLMSLAFLTETMAAMRQIKSTEVNMQTWRKAFLGNGRPADPKGETLRMCAMLGWDTGGLHDRADAMGVWVWAHLNHGNRKGIHAMLSIGSVRRMEG